MKICKGKSKITNVFKSTKIFEYHTYNINAGTSKKKDHNYSSLLPGRAAAADFQAPFLPSVELELAPAWTDHQYFSGGVGVE